MWRTENGGFRSNCHPDIFKPESLLLFHNDGNGKFTEVPQRAGIGKPGKSFGLAIADYDQDSWMDILVANDARQQFLFHNGGDGTFEEVGLASGGGLDGAGNSSSGMGVDFADYNNDGSPDIIFTDLANQRFARFTNLKDGSFDYATSVTGLTGSSLLHSGRGVGFMDYDSGRVEFARY